jgi:protein-disulfide isomerase
MISRRSIIAASTTAVLALPGVARATAIEGDMTLGAPDARVRLVEYASLTCPHCAAFHAEVFPRIKAEYIDARRISFTLREFPTAPVSVSVAMFQLARCGGADAATYFERVGVLFQQQRAILGTGSGQGVVDALVGIGGGWGFSREQVMAAMMDQAGVARIQGMVNDGRQRFDIQGTPAMVLNEEPLRGPASVTYVGLSDALNAALR